MTEKIKLVEGDTRPRIVLSIKDIRTGDPLDVSDAATFVRLKFRALGSTDVKSVLTCTKISGIPTEDLTINSAAPYDVPGKGGRVYVQWTSTSLDTAGDFAGEVEVSFGDGSVQTVYELLKFKVRKQF